MPKSSDDNQRNTPAKQNQRSETQNKGWAALLFVIIVALALSAVLNYTSTDDSAKKVEGTIAVDNGDQKINWDRYDRTEITLKDPITITQSGIYHLTGKLSDGGITVNAGDSGKVKLILDGVEIDSNTGPAILCSSADDLVIELVGVNKLTDNETYNSDLDEDVKATIYSKADLTFEGDGKLIIEANHEDAIVSKDDLKFNSGLYQITAKDDAIRGRDSVYIVDGTFDIESGADGIKTTNETTAGKGFVLIENGEIGIDAGAKGIKSINSILVQNGRINIKSYDDAIHSNNYVGIINGSIEIESGDDGIHADRELIIDGGNVTIQKSYEGLEAQKVTINDGQISIISSDDGINAGGGSDNSANNRPGAGAFDADEKCEISINGGDIDVNASGDGIDSNGAIYFNGGKIRVDGPTNNGNGAIDAGLEAYITGGELIAVGSSGMAVALSSGSSVHSLSVYFDSVQKAGTTISIKNSSGETVLSHISAKSFSHATIGSKALIAGESYTLYVDGVANQKFTITGMTTTLGEDRNNINNRFRR